VRPLVALNILKPTRSASLCVDLLSGRTAVGRAWRVTASSALHLLRGMFLNRSNRGPPPVAWLCASENNSCSFVLVTSPLPLANASAHRCHAAFRYEAFRRSRESSVCRLHQIRHGAGAHGDQ
jgi:hypothetical protein